jgi:polyisoprenyl-phosphate glycosyltransferase
MIEHNENVKRKPSESLVSVILPINGCCRELPLLAARIMRVLQPTGCEYELIFVNDASSDDSGNVLDKLADSSRHVKVLHLSRCFGEQAAIQAGLSYAGGDAVIVLDKEMQDDCEAIAPMLARWYEGYDVVYVVHNKYEKSKAKLFLSKVYHKLLSRSASIPMPSGICNSGLMDRRAAMEVLNIADRDRCHFALRSWVGFKQIGIGMEKRIRLHRCSKTGLRDTYKRIKKVLFSYSSLPLAPFRVIGTASALCFLALGTYAGVCEAFTNIAVQSWSGVCLLASFFSALNAFGIAVLGEYLLLILEQVRGRPSYVVERMVNMLPSIDSNQSQEDKAYHDLLLDAMNMLETAGMSQSRASQEMEKYEENEELLQP